MSKLSRLTNETAVANQSGAMEAETISKNGDSPKTQSSRANFFIFVCFALLAVFSGCDKDKDKEKSNSVDQKLVGKWDAQSVTWDGDEVFSNGKMYDPATDNVVTSMGFEFTSNTCKVFSNGSITENVSGVYTKENILYIPATTSGDLNFTWQLSGNILKLTGDVETTDEYGNKDGNVVHVVYTFQKVE